MFEGNWKLSMRNNAEGTLKGMQGMFHAPLEEKGVDENNRESLKGKAFKLMPVRYVQDIAFENDKDTCFINRSYI